MLVKKLCQRFFRDALKGVHQYRVNAMIDLVSTLCEGATLSLSSMGQRLKGRSKVKHKVKRVDRFLGNEEVYRESEVYYKGIARRLLTGMKVAYIGVDWSGCCSAETFMIRASLLVKGRGIPVYTMVRSQKEQETQAAHQSFLEGLKQIVPSEVEVVIITDAGFKTPWFNEVEKLGWGFIGRVRGRIQYRLEGEKKWQEVKALYGQARGRASYLGEGELGKTARQRSKGGIYLYQGQPKGRKKKRQKGKSLFPDTEKQYTAMQKEPWVIISSLGGGQKLAKWVINFYRKRMQIEQNFRDDKNIRWGFAWRLSFTRSIKRINALLLLASMATIILWLLGYMSEKRRLHYDFQANTVRNRRVLSFITLAKQVLFHGHTKITVKDFWYALCRFGQQYEALILCAA